LITQAPFPPRIVKTTRFHARGRTLLINVTESRLATTPSRFSFVAVAARKPAKSWPGSSTTWK